MATRRARRRISPAGTQRVVSFVVRFIGGTPAGGSAASWHGTVRHVQSGRETPFQRLDDALAFMCEFLPGHVLAERETDGPPP